MTRKQRMIEAFADYEVTTRDRVNRENVEVLVEMGWTREDATMFVNENPAEGENHARRSHDYTQVKVARNQG